MCIRDSAEALKNAGYDIVFSRYKEVHGVNFDPLIIQKTLGDSFSWLPWSMDEHYYYRFAEPIKYDVLYIGSQNPSIYPLRHNMFNGLGEFCSENDLSLYKRAGLGVPVWKAKIDELEAKGHPVGENYVRLMQTSRVGLFGNSRFRYPLQKNFEMRAAGCMVMSDAPVGAEDLGFKSGVDYVKVSIRTWRDSLRYYMENLNEVRIIAAAGRKLFLERHTHKVRAKELLEVLKKRR